LSTLGTVRSILLQGGMRIRSPMAALLDSSPLALARQLLDDIERGLLPVWPSTERYADRMVEGLEQISATRRTEVLRAVMLAPEHAVIDWRSRLDTLRI